MVIEKNNRAWRVVHEAFELSILIKGIDGLLEIIGSFLIWLVPPSAINALVLAITQHELSEDPNDLLFNFLVKAAHDLSVGAQFFLIFYLISHGIIKTFLVVALRRRRLWAYPVAIVFFFAFVVYQIYRFSYSHSLWLLILTIFDLLVIYLTWLEYKNIKNSVNQESASM